jgi:hypothetical protein
MFGQGCVHDVPWLRVTNEDVHRRSEPAWVIQTGCRQPDDIAFRVFPAGQARAAFGAEAALVVASAQSGRGMILQRAFGDLEGFQRHDHHGHIWSAARLLAIATMTIEHLQRAGTAFIADFAANASAAKRKFHGNEIILISEKRNFSSKP